LFHPRDHQQARLRVDGRLIIMNGHMAAFPALHYDNGGALPVVLEE
jgi:hypothetical protein